MNAVIEETITEQYANELSEARELLATVIAERGEDYVYSMPDGADDCQYLAYEPIEAYDGDDTYMTSDTDRPLGPSCLVGCMLAEKGIPLASIARVEGTFADQATLELRAFRHSAVRGALRSAQSAQDARESWGKAREAFEGAITSYEQRCVADGVPLGTEV